MSQPKYEPASSSRRSRRLSLGWAFFVGAVIGFAVGILRGWWMYGTFDMAYFYNHALGGLFIGGFLCMLVVALRNWSVRNPV